MKKDIIKKTIKAIKIFLIINVLCVCAALLFYGFLVFILSMFAISEHIQNLIFIFYSSVVVVAVGLINFFVFYDEFESKDSLNDN